MNDSNEHPDPATPGGPAQPDAVPQPAPYAAPYQPSPAVGTQAPSYAPPAEPKKRMSTGTKWAIGLAAAFVLVVLFACVASLVLLGSGGDTGVSLGDSIAVIHLEGTIQGGSGGSGTPEYMLDQLKQAREDTGVKAVLLRIDSPGGTVAASQEIMKAVQQTSAVKPVVASVGDICASGAYMVASQCDKIVASPGSTVGSIGVIMEIPNVEGLLDKVGVKFTTLTEGELKDAGSPYRSVTATETALMNEQMKLVYDQFILDVAKGRNMKEPDVRKLATGWAWIGSEALDLKLIDQLGNYDDAVKTAAKLGGIEGEPNIVSYEPTDPFSGLINSLLGLSSSGSGANADTLRRIALPK